MRPDEPVEVLERGEERRAIEEREDVEEKRRERGRGCSGETRRQEDRVATSWRRAASERDSR